jgi:hypothetical protein
MNKEIEVREAFAAQAKWCAILGSPLTAALVEGLGQQIDRKTGTGRIILDWDGPPDALGDSVPLRLAGALHGLVRRGQLPELASVYPPRDLPDGKTLTALALEAIRDHDQDVRQWLKHPPQTNEVGRSAALYPGMMQISARIGLPLALYEVGASAGLNMNMDKYAYQLAGEGFGDTGSIVQLAPDWRGPVPDKLEPVVIASRGCDRNPLDLTDPGQAERLISYVWPDQAERLARIMAACDIARDHPPVIDKSDAADWVEGIFGEPGEKGVVRVLYHSIAFQYFPDESKRRITDCMEAAGRRATSDAPVAWLAYELGESGRPTLTLRLWPNGETRLLAEGDAHVRELQWLG